MFVKWNNDVFIRCVREDVLICRPRIGTCLIMHEAMDFIQEISRDWKDADEIKKNLSKKFNVTIDQIGEDLNLVVAELREQGLIVESENFEMEKPASIYNLHPELSEDFTPLADFYIGNNIPSELHIDITDACTERCVHCYIPREGNSYLSYDYIDKVLQEFRDLQGLTVHLTGGECMLHPDFERICELCKSLNINIILFSNLTLCDTERIAFLSKLRPQFINVSLYSMDKEIHDAITGVRGSWKITIDAIKKCYDEGIPCRIAAPVLKQNKNSFRELKNFADNYHMHLIPSVDIIAQSDHCCLNLQNACSSDDLLKVLLADRDIFDKGWSAEMPSSDDKVCGIGVGRLYLNAKGKYYPCDSMHNYELGDVRDDTIGDVWSGAKLNYLRSLKNRDFAMCVQCDRRPWCKVCLAENFNATSNLFTPPKGHCNCANVIKEVYGGKKNVITAI